MNTAKFVLSVSGILLGALLFGCQSEDLRVSKKSEKMESIAVIGATDKVAQQGIAELFREHQIEYYTEGSVVYGVYVPEHPAKKALRLLIQSDSLKGRWRNPSDEWK